MLGVLGAEPGRDQQLDLLADEVAARVAEHLLGLDVDEHDLARDASLPQQPGLVALGAILASGKSVEDGQKALLAEVARLREAPPTAAELSEAKNELIAGKLRERETIDGRAFASSR